MSIHVLDGSNLGNIRFGHFRYVQLNNNGHNNNSSSSNQHRNALSVISCAAVSRRRLTPNLFFKGSFSTSPVLFHNLFSLGKSTVSHQFLYICKA